QRARARQMAALRQQQAAAAQAAAAQAAAAQAAAANAAPQVTDATVAKKADRLPSTGDAAPTTTSTTTQTTTIEKTPAVAKTADATTTQATCRKYSAAADSLIDMPCD
ncbi:MAG: hypothetical protein ABW006_02885, partial [Hyphomicrobium sp.]